MAKPISTPTRRAMIKTGIYTGDSIDNRNINIGVNLAAKANAYVIVKGNLAKSGMHRTEYSQGDLSMVFHYDGDFSNGIQGFMATGFQVGIMDEVNGSGVIYRYIVIWQEG